LDARTTPIMARFFRGHLLGREDASPALLPAPRHFFFSGSLFFFSLAKYHERKQTSRKEVSRERRYHERNVTKRIITREEISRKKYHERNYHERGDITKGNISPRKAQSVAVGEHRNGHRLPNGLDRCSILASRSARAFFFHIFARPLYPTCLLFWPCCSFLVRRGDRNWRLIDPWQTLRACACSAPSRVS